MKKDIKNIEASVRALLQNKAKEIENFLIKPLDAIKKDHELNKRMESTGDVEIRNR